MSDRNKVAKALAHSGFDDGDYIFINPRQVVRVLKANRKFIFLCSILGALLASGLSFFSVPIFVSEIKLKVQPQADAINITPLLDRFQGNDQLFTRTSAVLEEVATNDFRNLVLQGFIESKSNIGFIVPSNRAPILKLWLHRSIKKGLTRDEMQKHEHWDELRGHLAGTIEASANFDAGIITIKTRTKNPTISKRLADLAANALSDQNLTRLREKVFKLKDFVSSQTKERKAILEGLEAKRVTLQKRYEVGSTSDFSSQTYRRYNNNQIRSDEIARHLEINSKMLEKTEDQLKKIKENMASPTLTSSELFLSQTHHRMELLQYQKALIENEEGEAAQTQKEELQKELDETAENLRETLEKRDEAGAFSFISPQDYYKNLETTLVRIRDERTKLQTERETINRSLATDKREIAKIPNILQEFESLQRQISVSSELFLGLQQRLQEVEIMEAGIDNDLKLLGPANRPSSPIGLPPSIRIIASFFAGLFLALLVLILKNTFIHTIRNYRELQNEGVNVIGEVPILAGLKPPIASFLGKNLDRMLGQQLGTVTDKLTVVAPKVIRGFSKFAPTIISNQIDKGLSQLGKIHNTLGLKNKPSICELIVLDQPNSNEADIFRYMRLRLNAYVQQTLTHVPAGKGKVILITSPTESVGKTFISTNLAASFGKGEIKTLLIDLDLRNSSINRTFADFKDVPGIETAVKKKEPLEDYIISVSRFFDVLLCNPGISNPTEILESQTLRDFIEKMRDKYDYIFLDSPPALVVCDPSLIAPIADMILMVAAFEITFREDISLAIEGLNAGKAHPIVGVLNLVDSGFDRYGYGYGYGYGKKKAG